MLSFSLSRFARTFALLFTASLATPPLDAATPWTTFQNGGRLDLTDTITPAEGSPLGPELWSAKIPGYGQSSPVVWKNRVFVTSVEGPQREKYHITAFSIDDGKLLWTHSLKNPTPGENTGYVSKAAPTPAVDGAGLVCFFEGGSLLSLSHAGQVQWERDLVAEFGPIDSRHGIAGSVEQSDGLGYIWMERGTDPYVLAFDKKTGKDAWKVPGIGATSWSSPRLVPVAGGEHLVLSGVGSLTGLDPATGEKLWKLEGVAGNSTPTPIPLGDGRFLIGATDGRGEETNAGKPAESNGVVEIRKGDDGQWTAGYVWRAKRATSSFGSPIAAGGNAYIVNRTGVLYCLDLATGEERFVERTGESVWSTPVADEHAVLLFGKSGTVTAIAKGSTFKSLGSGKVWTDEPPMEPAPMPPAGEARPGRGGPPGPPAGPTLYGVALADGRLLARRGEKLFCLKYGSAK